MARPRRTQISDSDEDGDWTASRASASELEGVRRCKVDGCGISLAHEKTFFRRARCCQAHARQLTVSLNGEEKRLCQQCSSFHPLTAFDGTKRSCRERLESHKIRQRQLNNRRMAQAAAFQAAQAAAENSPVVPAATGVQVPNLTACAFMTPQQPGQQPPVMQVQATTSYAAQQLQQQYIMQQQAPLRYHAAPQMPPQLQQTPQQTPDQSPQQAPPPYEGSAGVAHDATMLSDAPDIFADMALDELPVDVQPERQEAKRSCEQPSVDVHKLSSFWDGPPPAFEGGRSGHVVNARSRSTREAQLGWLDAEDGICDAIMHETSFRSMSAGAGSEGFPGWAGATPSCFGGPYPATGIIHGGRLSCSSFDGTFNSENERSWQRCTPFEAATSTPFRRPATSDLLPPRRSVKRMSLDSHMEPQFHRGQRSIKRASLDLVYGNGIGGGCGEGWESDEASTRLAGLRSCAEDSPEEQGFGAQGFERLAAATRRHSLSSYESRGSDASSPSHLTPPPLPSARRLSVGCSSAPLPPLVKRRSLNIVCGANAEAEARAFQEQAPEPLYLAAQLVKDMGLRKSQLPEFSYGRGA